MGPDSPEVMKEVWRLKFNKINSLQGKNVTLQFPRQPKKPANQPPPGWVHSLLPPNDLPCQYCSKTFSNPKKLRKHEAKHEDPSNHWCKICNRSFRSLEAMNRHISFRHETYTFKPKQNRASNSLPPVVPQRELKAAKRFYEDKFITSFPRL